MNELEDYKSKLAEIATFATETLALSAATIIQKYDKNAHFCLEWDGLFIYPGMSEFDEVCKGMCNRQD